MSYSKSIITTRMWNAMTDRISDQVAKDAIVHDTAIEYLVAQASLKEMQDKVLESAEGDARRWWEFRLSTLEMVFERFDKLSGEITRLQAAVKYYSDQSETLLAKLTDQQEFEDKLIELLLTKESNEHNTSTAAGDPGSGVDPQKEEE